MGSSGWAASSYVFNLPLFGTAATKATGGIANWGSHYDISSIPDGSSNTVSFAERLSTCGPASPVYSDLLDAGGSYTNSDPDFNIATAIGGPFASPPVLPTTPQIGVDQISCNTATYGTVGTTTLNAGMEPSTGHVGAIVVGMADGSVRMVGSGVGQTTWFYAVNPADRMPLGSDW